MHSNVIEKYKKTLTLTRHQREIIVGTLLGDGHLETQDGGRTYRLKIEHSLKQKEYVDWLYDQFKEWVGGRPRIRVQQSTLPQGVVKSFTSCGFTTYSHGAFRFYGQQFYTNQGKKIVPKMIAKLLTPAAIAIWYLDDGSWKSKRHKTFIIHTHGYRNQDLRLLQQTLDRFGVNTLLHRQIRETGIYWRLYILSESAAKFRELIEPTIKQVPTMRYKLGNKMPKE